MCVTLQGARAAGVKTFVDGSADEGYAWAIRPVVEEWQEQRAHTLLRSHRLPVRTVGRRAGPASGRPQAAVEEQRLGRRVP